MSPARIIRIIPDTFLFQNPCQFYLKTQVQEQSVYNLFFVEQSIIKWNKAKDITDKKEQIWRALYNRVSGKIFKCVCVCVCVCV